MYSTSKFPDSASFSLSNFLPYEDGVGYDPLNSEFRRRLVQLPVAGRFVISAKDEFRADLMSHQLYGSTQYWWILLDYNKLDSPEQLKVGTKISYPSLDALTELFSLLKAKTEPEEDTSPQEILLSTDIPFLAIAEPAGSTIYFESTASDFVKIKLDPVRISSTVIYDITGRNASDFTVDYVYDSEGGFFRLYPNSQNLYNPVTLEAAENRKAKLTFYCGEAQAEVDIVQYGDKQETLISLDGATNEIEFDSYRRNSREFRIIYKGNTPKLNYSIPPEASWLSFIGFNYNEIMTDTWEMTGTVWVDENKFSSDRKACVEFSTSNGVSFNLTVSQPACKPSIDVYETSLVFPYGANGVSEFVRVDVRVSDVTELNTVTYPSTWVNVQSSVKIAEGVSMVTLNISVTSNEGTDNTDRYGSVIIKDSTGRSVHTISIFQYASSTQPSYFVKQNALSFDNSKSGRTVVNFLGGGEPTSIKVSVDKEASSWLSATQDGVIMTKPVDKSYSLPRIGNVLFTFNGNSTTVKVKS